MQPVPDFLLNFLLGMSRLISELKCGVVSLSAFICTFFGAFLVGWGIVDPRHAASAADLIRTVDVTFWSRQNLAKRVKTAGGE